MSTEQNSKEANDGVDALNVELDAKNAQIAESIKCDFYTNQWVFQLPEGFRAGAGKYLIVKIKT